ncbi:MAG: hypothetical protein A2X12_06425 [Bacteroidetes bacterium GWE2_29_8]|nr:MAG: hypothetical protein A2X12_06425 [Bacteroidetes bacterium GWE2_29_8]
MAQSSIEWTEMTWNPTTGCTKISSGCKFCYAEVMSKRLKGMRQQKYKDGFELRIHPESLNIPYTWKSSKIVFVNSMSDLFHKDIPIDFVKKVFKVMNDNPQHIFQVLTKRADYLYEINKELEWSKNIWMGVTVENDKVIDRIDFLRKTKAKIKFISFEPLIGGVPILNLKKIDWAIVGGESGHNARAMNPEWVLDIQKQCNNENIAFFFKQWGTWSSDGIKRNKKVNGKEINGVIYQKMPINN